MSTHDLRRRLQHFTDLRRRKEARDVLTDEEMAELQRGIPASEMREHVEAIRGERRSAAPARKVKEKAEKAEKAAKAATKATPTPKPAEPVDILSFLDEEHDDV
jgi:peptidoglycan hydrolase CwlO-like protein